MLTTCTFLGAEVHKTENTELLAILCCCPWWRHEIRNAAEPFITAAQHCQLCWVAYQKGFTALGYRCTLQCDRTAVEITPPSSHRSHLVPSIFKVFFDALLRHPPHRALRLLVVTSSLASQSCSSRLTDNICQTAAVRKPTLFICFHQTCFFFFFTHTSPAEPLLR